jgi:hypothetical protein
MFITLTVKQRIRVGALAHPNTTIGRFSRPQAEERAVLTPESRIRARAAEVWGWRFVAHNGFSPLANLVREARVARPTTNRFISALTGHVVVSDGDPIGEVAYRVGEGEEGE